MIGALKVLTKKIIKSIVISKQIKIDFKKIIQISRGFFTRYRPEFPLFIMKLLKHDKFKVKTVV